MTQSVLVGGQFHFTCFDENGLKWEDLAPNLVTNEGLQHMLDVTFAGSSQTATWYVRLLDSDPAITAGTTVGAISEFTEYSEAAGQEFVDVRSNQTVTNSASTATFSINTAGSGVGGAALVSTATGSSAILLCGAALSGSNRTVADGDSVVVTYTFTAADDGA